MGSELSSAVSKLTSAMAAGSSVPGKAAEKESQLKETMDFNQKSMAVTAKVSEAYKGREKELIVISTVRSNPDGELGFVRDARRMNVAISRARRGLVVCGDAATLGADVPVFVRGHSAWAEGIGERLTPVTLDTPWFVVIHPGEEIATPAVFGHPELTRDTPPISMARALRGGAEQGRAWRNDCEAVVRRLSPDVAHALGWLSAFGPAMLTKAFTVVASLIWLLKSLWTWLNSIAVWGGQFVPLLSASQ